MLCVCVIPLGHVDPLVLFGISWYPFVIHVCWYVCDCCVIMNMSAFVWVCGGFLCCCAFSVVVCVCLGFSGSVCIPLVISSFPCLFGVVVIVVWSFVFMCPCGYYVVCGMSAYVCSS